MKKTGFCFLFVFLLLMCACSRSEDDIDWNELREDLRAVPGRMVKQVDIHFVPDNPDFTRHYTQKPCIDHILLLIRDLQTNDIPDRELSLNDGQSYFTINVIYTNNEKQVYYLMGHRFLYIHEIGWREVPSEKAMYFLNYLNTHPSDCLPNPNPIRINQIN